MTKPKNLPGVVFGAILLVVIVSTCLALGLDTSTRKGAPVWLLLVVGVAASGWVIVGSWRKPRSSP
jgi:hypothetical protein